MPGWGCTHRAAGDALRRLLRLLTVASVLAALLAAAAPASAYKEWNHSTALGKRSCAVGCHAEQTPTNATCTGCHAGFKTRGTQKCWSCHEPGADTSAWQLAAGCTTTCHLLTSTDDEPAYATSYAHTRSAHLGASGYGKTCVDCHGVSSGATAPGASPHHDAVDSSAPDCAGCHDGGIASAPAGHASFGADCGACHTGMDRPSGECSACHVGRTDTAIPQIAYTNTLACADAGCHGTVAVHAGTPIGAAPCTTCHAAHYGTLGPCTTCHPDPQTFHHGTAAARPARRLRRLPRRRHRRGAGRARGLRRRLRAPATPAWTARAGSARPATWAGPTPRSRRSPTPTRSPAPTPAATAR